MFHGGPQFLAERNHRTLVENISKATNSCKTNDLLRVSRSSRGRLAPIMSRYAFRNILLQRRVPPFFLLFSFFFRLFFLFFSYFRDVGLPACRYPIAPINASPFVRWICIFKRRHPPFGKHEVFLAQTLRFRHGAEILPPLELFPFWLEGERSSFLEGKYIKRI